MKTIISFIVVIYDAMVGFVAAFIKEFVGKREFNDHSGYQSFVKQTRDIALQVKLSLHELLSKPQLRPT